MLLLNKLYKAVKQIRLVRCYHQTGEEGALAGIKVLDLTRILAGPYCTMILGDLGADIIKVERPGVGDETRRWGPPYVNDTNETCYFVCLNRNKRSICVDLKTKEGKQIIERLATECDVLVENYVPGTLGKLGLGYQQLHKTAPHLVYCSITGYGSKGPYKQRPGYDVIASSVGGLMNITGEENGIPCKPGVATTDIATGLYAHGAILAALLHKQRTGKGQKIDCDLLSTQIACLINIGSNYLNASKESHRSGNSHVSIVPYRAYLTKDGRYLTIGAGSDEQFKHLCARLDINIELDERFTTNKLRVANREVLDQILQNIFSEKVLADWLRILEGSSFPYGPVNKTSEVFKDPHVQDINIVQEIESKHCGTIKLVGPPVEYSMSVNKIHREPPALGQHTDVVMKEFGYTQSKIDELRKINVIS